MSRSGGAKPLLYILLDNLKKKLNHVHPLLSLCSSIQVPHTTAQMQDSATLVAYANGAVSHSRHLTFRSTN